MDEMTFHARKRAQQRCIPPLINQWLSDYGATEYDGHGGVRRYFNKKSIKDLNREFGKEPVKLLSKYWNAYMVEGVDNSRVITTGYLNKRIKRA